MVDAMTPFQVDGIQDSRGVLVVGCTNRPLSELDPAMLRPGRWLSCLGYCVAGVMYICIPSPLGVGRLERQVYVGAPTFEDRRQILAQLCQRTPVDADVSLEQLAAATDGHTCAALGAMFRSVCMSAIDQFSS